MSLKSSFYFLSPIEVVKVTPENLEAAAEWCGGVIDETESRRAKGRMDKYVLVPTPKGNSTSWAFPGMFITKRLVVTEQDTLRATFSVFRRDYFQKNCFETIQDSVDGTWERAEREKTKVREFRTEVGRAVQAALSGKAPKGFVKKTDLKVIPITEETVDEANHSIVLQRELEREAIVEAEAAPEEADEVDSRP